MFGPFGAMGTNKTAFNSQTRYKSLRKVEDGSQKKPVYNRNRHNLTHVTEKYTTTLERKEPKIHFRQAAPINTPHVESA